MTIRTNTKDRKAPANKIAELPGQEAVYQRTPSYAYAAGPVTAGRDGNIICEDAEAPEALQPFLLEHGYTEINVAATETNTADSDTPGVAVPISGMDGNQLRNLMYILYGYRYLLNRITRHETFHISEAVIESLTGNAPFNSSGFIERMNSFTASGDLRGAAFSAEIITLVFPREEDNPEKTKAYMKLACAIVDAAKTAKRADVTIRRPENEKYVLRSWLLKLGMGGADFTAERKALLEGLNGHTAFPNEAAARKHRDKYAEIRRIARALREGGA
jgi:hypothetical protein